MADLEAVLAAIEKRLANLESRLSTPEAATGCCTPNATKNTLTKDVTTAYKQGQLPLKRYTGNNFRQELIAPTARAAFHRDAVLAGMLL
jgi:hypothetical protein